MSNKRQLWSLYLTAKTLGQRPSDLVCIDDRWLALQFDNAVVLAGVTLENASQEQVNTGGEKQPKYEPKYRMAELLADDFRLPAPVVEKRPNGIQGLLAMAGKGVKVYRAKG